MVGGVVWYREIIMSALSLSLRDKDRLRDRESLTMYIFFQIFWKDQMFKSTLVNLYQPWSTLVCLGLSWFALVFLANSMYIIVYSMSFQFTFKVSSMYIQFLSNGYPIYIQCLLADSHTQILEMLSLLKQELQL